MQRLFAVLTAYISFTLVASPPALAQVRYLSDPSVPAPGSGRTTGQSERAAVEAGTNVQPLDQETTTNVDSHRSEDGSEVIERSEVRDSINVQGAPLIIKGRVRRDVIAVNSDVTVKPGAKVGGHLIMVGGNLDNRVGKALRVVTLDPALASVFATAPGARDDEWSARTRGPQAADDAGAAKASARGAWPMQRSRAPRSIGRLEWFGAQFGLLLFGLLGALIMQLVAPRAGRRTAERIESEPGRCLATGAIGALAVLTVLIFNGALMGSLVGIIYAPFGAVIALALAAILAYGWLCAMHTVGDFFAARSGRRIGDMLAARVAIGLLAFFVINSALGAMPGGVGTALGGFGLALQTVVAMAGLGALLMTGGGTDPDWLEARLRGRARWLSFGRR